jgi:hypothetical protein
MVVTKWLKPSVWGRRASDTPRTGVTPPSPVLKLKPRVLQLNPPCEHSALEPHLHAWMLPSTSELRHVHGDIVRQADRTN